MVTQVKQICVRYVPLEPDEAQVCRSIVLELQALSILRAAGSHGHPPKRGAIQAADVAAPGGARRGDNSPEYPRN